MPSPAVRIATITEGLAALGLSPEVMDHGDHSCITSRVSNGTSAQAWQRILALLETADSFGLVSNARRGQVLWAAIRKGGLPRNGSAVQGHDDQL